MRSEQKIEQHLNDKLPDGADGPSKSPGMTYEQGVDAALRWALGWTNDEPLVD